MAGHLSLSGYRATMGTKGRMDSSYDYVNHGFYAKLHNSVRMNHIVPLIKILKLNLSWPKRCCRSQCTWQKVCGTVLQLSQYSAKLCSKYLL